MQSVTQTYHRISFNLRPQLEKWLQEWQDNDLIESVVNKCTELVSGVVIVPKPKKPAELRVCGDYRRINEAIKREHHPMPTIEELTDDMSNAAHFSRLDLRSGYLQIVLNEESRGTKTFTTHKVFSSGKDSLSESIQQVKCFKMLSSMHCKD